jgi:hypothetical protein
VTGPADDRAPDWPLADDGPRDGGAPDEGWHDAPHEGSREEPRERRPWIERIGLAGIAIVLGGLFGFVAVVAWSGGEPFLAVMGGIGCLMTLWVGGLTLVRG